MPSRFSFRLSAFKRESVPVRGLMPPVLSSLAIVLFDGAFPVADRSLRYVASICAENSLRCFSRADGGLGGLPRRFLVERNGKNSMLPRRNLSLLAATRSPAALIPLLASSFTGSGAYGSNILANVTPR